jgi:hypothetical protein
LEERKWDEGRMGRMKERSKENAGRKASGRSNAESRREEKEQEEKERGRRRTGNKETKNRDLVLGQVMYEVTGRISQYKETYC